MKNSNSSTKTVDNVRKKSRRGTRPTAFNNKEDSNSRHVADLIIKELSHFYENFEPRGHGQSLYEQHRLVNKPFFGFINKPEGALLMCRHYPPMYFDPYHKDIEYYSYMGTGGAQMVQEITKSNILFRSTFDPQKKQTRGEANDVTMENRLFSFFTRSLHKLLGMSNEDIVKLEESNTHWNSPATPSLGASTISTEDDTTTPAQVNSVPTQDTPLHRKVKTFKPNIAVDTTAGIHLADRYMLDDVQDPIFRQKLQGPILISGPPGTGKTTVQVKRLAQKTKWQFLTQEERQGLEEEDWDENKNWIFFTPSNLLKSYLKEALAAEYLAASDQRVRVWDDYRTELLKRLGFFKNRQTHQLKRAKAGDSHLLSTSSDSITSLAKYFLDYLYQSLGAKSDTSGHTQAPPLVNQEKVNEGIGKIPGIFQKFRSNDTILDKFYGDSALIQGKQNIDSVEMTLLLYSTLSLIRDTERVYEIKFAAPKANQSSPAYSLIRDQAMVVAIDEASDFSALEIACMSLLSDPRKKSLTLSGDLMQRLTSNGIKDWSELESFGINLKTFDLYRPYRQTSRLTEIAQVLDNRAENPELIIENDHNDPPVILNHTNTTATTAEWVSSKILEIADEYPESLPTIGVLIPHSSEVSEFAKLLEEHLYSHAIDVEAVSDGKFFGDTGKVRVFSLEHIKGLEFDTVFFCHLDELERQHTELLTRFLYVGISRCKRQLFMTYKDQLPQALQCITPYIENIAENTPARTWRTMCDPADLFSESSAKLLDQHFGFYQDLCSGAISPSSDKQKLFIEACQNGTPINDIHITAYQEFLNSSHSITPF